MAHSLEFYAMQQQQQALQGKLCHARLQQRQWQHPVMGPARLLLLLLLSWTAAVCGVLCMKR